MPHAQHRARPSWIHTAGSRIARCARVMGRAIIAGCVLNVGCALILGCATVPEQTPFRARIARPQPGEVVLAEDSIIVVDASGSTDRQVGFPAEKALVRSFVDGMPPGTYRSAMRVLGGREDDQLHLEKFDRYDLRAHAEALQWTGRETPLRRIFDEYRETLADRSGRAVFFVFSDGVPTRYGKFIGTEDTLSSARQLEARHSGEVCFHMVQMGTDPRGEALLRDIAGLGGCGSFRHIDDLHDTDSLHAFQQQAYNGPPPPAPPPPVRAMTDLDGDGVDDRFDRCAKTPRGAVVDDRGCWVIEDYVFDTDSARIRSEHVAPLDAVVTVLTQNPSLRIRLDGHTDDTGTADYNFSLAERRAAAVRDHLIAGGVAPERLEVRGFGPTRPIDTNDTVAGRRRNRRVEISVIDW